jgi:hypothetical protein
MNRNPAVYDSSGLSQYPSGTWSFFFVILGSHPSLGTASGVILRSTNGAPSAFYGPTQRILLAALAKPKILLVPHRMQSLVLGEQAPLAISRPSEGQKEGSSK